MNVITLKDCRKALLTALWFMFLTFPILVIKVNTTENQVIWRWQNLVYVGTATCIASLLASIYRHYRDSRGRKREQEHHEGESRSLSLTERFFSTPAISRPVFAAGALFFLVFPLLFSTYQVNIMTTALMYVVLGLGLNIVVGVAGLLNLGYVAFYAVGAYTYALLNMHFGIGFWIALPLGGIMAALFGILLGFPVLRLRGDYLAIVTLGFGEIILVVLKNWGEFSQGPGGISNISRPGFFGVNMTMETALNYQYYLTIAMVVLTIFVINRLQNSRIGRALFALREDEIACQAMGIDKTTVKLTAFALGATWAGLAGVLFAAKNAYINPDSFTFLESAMILCIVLLGGMGSIVGVIIGALILILLPEYLRAFSDYRMLAFGALLVIMMVFRPQGIIANVRRTYHMKDSAS